MLSQERVTELRAEQNRLYFFANALHQTYTGLLSQYQSVCQIGKPADIENMREQVLASVGDILDNVRAQQKVMRELSGIPCD